MAYGIIGYSQQNNLDQPSGAIWGDCSAQELLDEGSGYFDFKDFKAVLPSAYGVTDVAGTATLAAQPPNWLTATSGTASFSYNTHYDSVVQATTGTTANDDAGIATRPVGPIAPGSGQKVWFETLVSVAQISAAQSVFVGVANLASLASKSLMAASSATKNSNTIGGASGSSFYGFWMHGDTPTNFDAVWANAVTTPLTPTTIGQYSTHTSSSSGSSLVLANVLTPTITTYPNSLNPLGYVGPTPVSVPPGALIATATANATPTGYATAQTPQQLLHIGLPPSVGATLGATGFVKLGIRYDGQQYLYYYVNGVQVAKIVITSGNDTVSNFAGVVQVMTGTAAAVTLNVGFERTAALIYP